MYGRLVAYRASLIDASTTSAAFRRELRWNQAFYFLDRGP